MATDSQGSTFVFAGSTYTASRSRPAVTCLTTRTWAWRVVPIAPTNPRRW